MFQPDVRVLADSPHEPRAHTSYGEAYDGADQQQPAQKRRPALYAPHFCPGYRNQDQDYGQNDNIVHPRLYLQSLPHRARDAAISQDFSQHHRVSRGQDSAADEGHQPPEPHQERHRYCAQGYYQRGPRHQHYERNEPALAKLVHLKPHGVQEQHQGQC
jgi:hypothetical protein